MMKVRLHRSTAFESNVNLRKLFDEGSEVRYGYSVIKPSVIERRITFRQKQECVALARNAFRLQTASIAHSSSSRRRERQTINDPCTIEVVRAAQEFTAELFQQSATRSCNSTHPFLLRQHIRQANLKFRCALRNALHERLLTIDPFSRYQIKHFVERFWRISSFYLRDIGS